MTRWKQKLTLALGVTLTLAMSQTSDAQLFRFRRVACPQPAANQCCTQRYTENTAREFDYQAPQAVVESGPVATVPAATFFPVVEQTSAPIFVQSEFNTETSLNPSAVDSAVVPAVFESTPPPPDI